MHKISTYLISIFFSILLFFIILFSATELIAYNLNYYKWHYINRDIEEDTGMDINGLMNTTELLIDYLKDKRDSLDFKETVYEEYREVFNQREKDHMKDVKDLAIGAKKIRDYGFIIVFLIFIISFFTDKEMFKRIISSVKYVFSAMISLIILLGLLLLIDFNKYFTVFHLIFFKNDLWILDPMTDTLINMVPEVFFFTTAMIVIVLFLIISSLIILSFELIKRKININNR